MPSHFAEQIFAAVKPYNDKIIAEAKANRLELQNVILRDALEECEEYLDNRADVKDGDYGIPEPNAEMILVAKVRAALGKGGI